MSEHHKRLLEAAIDAGVTIEDLARAWASIDGRRDKFDAGKTNDRDVSGHYDGYMIEAEEQVKRATQYARDRSHTIIKDIAREAQDLNWE